jgi:hypothetical protein
VAIARVLQEHGVFPGPAAEIAEAMDEQGLTPDKALEVFLDVLAATDDIGLTVYRLRAGFWDTAAQDRALDKARQRRYGGVVLEGELSEGQPEEPPSLPAVVEPDPSIWTPIGTFRTAEQVWQAALAELQLETTQATFNTLLRRSRLVAYDDGAFTVAVPSEYARDWLASRLASTVRRVLHRLTKCDDVTVRFVTETEWAEKFNVNAEVA